MYKELVIVCCAITLILVSTTEAKGGRGGGGRSSGRSSGKSSSGRGGLFSSSSGSGKSSIVGGKSSNSFSGGWFHGFFHSSPYRYTYRPHHIVHSSSSSTNTGSYHTATQEEDAEQKKETSDYAVGYSISKALSNDFFSVFNVVHDISKYPEKIRNKELLTTTTQNPVATYDLNYKANTPHTTTSTTYGFDPKSYLLDYDTLFRTMNSKSNLENNADIPSSVGNFENIFVDVTTESTTTKIDTKSYPNEDTLFGRTNTNSRFFFNDNFQKQLVEIQSNLAKIRGGLEVESTESTSMETSLDSTYESIDDIMKRIQAMAQ